MLTPVGIFLRVVFECQRHDGRRQDGYNSWEEVTALPGASVVDRKAEQFRAKRVSQTLPVQSEQSAALARQGSNGNEFSVKSPC